MSSATSLKSKFEELARPKDPNVEEVTKTSWATSGNSGGMSNEGKFQKSAVVVGTKKKGAPLPLTLNMCIDCLPPIFRTAAQEEPHRPPVRLWYLLWCNKSNCRRR